jgi:hypothetical protein
VAAIDAARDPIQPVVVSGYTLRTFSLAAGLIIDSRYVTDDVITQAASDLEAAFAFEKRAFGQPVTAAEVITIIQAVPGVIAVDLDRLALDSSQQTNTVTVPTRKSVKSSRPMVSRVLPNSKMDWGRLSRVTLHRATQPPAILQADQVELDTETGQIQLAELLLINTQGISLTKKEMSS